MRKKRAKSADPVLLTPEEVDAITATIHRIDHWTAKIATEAKRLQKMNESVNNIPLGEDRRRILNSLSNISPAFKARLTENNPEFSVAEIIRIAKAISKALPETASDSKRLEMLWIARAVLRSARYKLIGRETKHRPKPNPKEETADKLATIIRLIDQFCRGHLNEEYANVCRKLAEKLARKRPTPILKGSPNTWASGIVRTIGWVNFLHDQSQTPHMRLSDIDPEFGISESSGAAKLAAIRKMLNLTPLNHEWTLPSRMEHNPLIWMLTVNGFVMDIRQAPREAQEAAFEKGLIPYIPADR